jgi:hypothetical protein
MLTKKESLKVLKKENPNLSEHEIAQVYNLLIKLASIEFEDYKIKNS